MAAAEIRNRHPTKLAKQTMEEQQDGDETLDPSRVQPGVLIFFHSLGLEFGSC